MQAVLLGLVVAGLVAIVFGYDAWEGRTKVVVNGCVALSITALPAAMERNYELPVDPWLGLWITSAVFFHAIGSAGFYHGVWWWDHLTHALSASLVAGVGYTAMRAVDVHDPRIQLPHRFLFAFILIFVLGFGVLWEVLEFGVDVVATAWGIEAPFAQLGVEDTVKDLAFDGVGALLVAAFGQAHLSGFVEELREQLQAAD